MYCPDVIWCWHISCIIYANSCTANTDKKIIVDYVKPLKTCLSEQTIQIQYISWTFIGLVARHFSDSAVFWLLLWNWLCKDTLPVAATLSSFSVSPLVRGYCHCEQCATASKIHFHQHHLTTVNNKTTKHPGYEILCEEIIVLFKQGNYRFPLFKNNRGYTCNMGVEKSSIAYLQREKLHLSTQANQKTHEIPGEEAHSGDN